MTPPSEKRQRSPGRRLRKIIRPGGHNQGCHREGGWKAQIPIKGKARGWFKKERVVGFAECRKEMKEERNKTEMQPRVLSIRQPLGSLDGVSVTEWWRKEQSPGRDNHR